jgi:uncharacterized protein (DUF111 family)
MAVASLLDLGADKTRLEKAIASIDFAEGPVELIIQEKLNMGIRGVYFNTAEDHHEHEHKHQHENGHKHAHAHDHSHAHDHEHAHAHAHGHDHSHDHDHDHDHEHAHAHDHSHDHNHDHGHSHSHEHHQHAPHRGMKEIRQLIEKADLTENARNIALKCFEALARAEATIHGKEIDEVHFHEVGARDSIVDMIGTAVCLDDLGIDKVVISPVHLGSGMVKCAHGVIPVPAPATALLLKGFSVVMDVDVPHELTTPTGAAILKGLDAHLIDAQEFAYEAVGHGLGSKNIGRPNFLRAFLKKSSGQKKKLI